MGIIWSDTAKKRLREIFHYYEKEATTERAIKIITEIVLSAEKLREFPEMAAVEPLLNNLPQTFRSLILKKNYKLIYYSDMDNIYIVTVWNCRQNPKNLKKEIKE